MKRNSTGSGAGLPASQPSGAGVGAHPLRDRVWRISAHAPLGEWVQRGAQVKPPSNADDQAGREANWATSTFDLLDGVTVIETSDVASVALLDLFFEPPDSRKIG